MERALVIPCVSSETKVVYAVALWCMSPVTRFSESTRTPTSMDVLPA